MGVSVVERNKVWTEEELMRLPEDGYIHEVVDGELVMSPKNNFQHGSIFNRFFLAMAQFNRRHRLGIVRGSDIGFWMQNRNCRAPDISFIPKARLESLAFKPNSRRFFPGAPDLAIEILSPNNVRSEIDERLRDFFASGTQIAWVINPDEECAEVCHSLTDRKLLGPGASLDGEHLLPGFSYPIGGLFKEWDWDESD
jgi:Uma2 family endonuclease